MPCPLCDSQSVTPINLEGTVFECGTCRHRFHPSGVVPTDVCFTVDSAAVNSDLFPLFAKNAVSSTGAI
ncbi:MAG: hypothetical protein R6V84_17190 [Desulfobacterales bacterium]